MKRKRRTKVYVKLSEVARTRIAAALTNAMYSQGFPGHPPGKPLDLKLRLRLVGEDAVSLAEVSGRKFAPPKGREKATRGKRK